MTTETKHYLFAPRHTNEVVVFSGPCKLHGYMAIRNNGRCTLALIDTVTPSPEPRSGDHLQITIRDVEPIPFPKPIKFKKGLTVSCTSGFDEILLWIEKLAVEVVPTIPAPTPTPIPHPVLPVPPKII